MRCFFVSDLHGKLDRYSALLDRIASERPQAVFLGGDLLPNAFDRTWAADLGPADFVTDVLGAGFSALREGLGPRYPRVLVILGNDDPRAEEAELQRLAAAGLWDYVHDRSVRLGTCGSLTEEQGEGGPDAAGGPAAGAGPGPRLGQLTAYGYAFVPPSPFLLKDWERYDVSRFVDPGCTAPDEGALTVPVPELELRFGTIHRGLARLVGDDDVSRAIFLFHSPPYQSNLDRAALDGKMVDHVPLDVHVGSIAIRRFIADRQPLLTLHGHVHESARLTGSWRDRDGRTHMFGAAHDGPELALVRFDTDDLEAASRELI
ncbi:MAG: metallophosphoesterase [Anaerolineae bacterium]